MPNANVRAIGVLALLFAGVASCIDEEARMRKRIAGDYKREFDGGGGWYVVRHVLTLREDGTWRQTSTTRYRGRVQENLADTGTYRITGITLNVRSLAIGGIYHYTVVGDTLFSANATMAYKFTGYDIGEDTLVRVRSEESR